MKCEEFKKIYLGPKKMDDDLFMDCMDHVRDCIACRDHSILVGLRNDGVNIGRYPCVHMAKYATFKCELHPDLGDCPDAIVIYSPKFDEYAINNPRPAFTPISNCPWCGTRLPNKSERWFKELELLGFDEPFEQAIPEKYKSDAWYINS